MARHRHTHSDSGIYRVRREGRVPPAPANPYNTHFLRARRFAHLPYKAVNDGFDTASRCLAGQGHRVAPDFAVEAAF
jgi:hypothetical protein